MGQFRKSTAAVHVLLLAGLAIATPAAAAQVLAQLVAPARDVLGPEAGDAVAGAARAARMHL